jgi:hypothetical protein
MSEPGLVWGLLLLLLLFGIQQVIHQRREALSTNLKPAT